METDNGATTKYNTDRIKRMCAPTTREVSIEWILKWHDLKTHFGRIAMANGWEDEQCRVALPTCLTSWALDEFSAMPQMYKTRKDGQPAPTLQRMLGYLDGKMSAFHDRTTSRLEFIAMVQGQKESIKDFAGRLRSMCDIAFATYNAAFKDEFNRDQVN